MAAKAWVENVFNAVMVAVIIYNLSRVPPLAKNMRMPEDRQRVLTQPGPLLMRNGTLEESGWSRLPLKTFSRANFGAVVFGVPRLSALKYRKIDEYVVFGARAVTVLIAYESPLRSFFLVGRYDLTEKTFEHESRQKFGALPEGLHLHDELHLCPASRAEMKRGVFSVEISTDKRGGDCATRIGARLSSGKELNIALESPLLGDAVVETARISPDGRHWLHSFKKLARSSDGDGEGLAAVHLTRGLTYYKSTALFGTAAAKLNGTDFSLNFGVLPAHNATATTEDSFTLNHTAHKLGPLEVRFDRLNLLNGFTVQSAATGDPLLAGTGARSAAEFVFRSEAQAQLGANYFLVKNRWELVFGTVSGWVSDESGAAFHFEEVPAYARIFDLKG